MGFFKKLWKDRVSEYPNRRILTDEDNNETLVTVARSEGNISEVGDAFSAENMNDLEQRVADGFEETNNSLNELSKNNIGTSVDISSYTSSNPYIFPSNGYILLEVLTGVDNSLYGFIIGNNGNRIIVQASGAKSNVRMPVYVRKGMKWYQGESIGTTNAYFYAFQ